MFRFLGPDNLTPGLFLGLLTVRFVSPRNLRNIFSTHMHQCDCLFPSLYSFSVSLSVSVSLIHCLSVSTICLLYVSVSFHLSLYLCLLTNTEEVLECQTALTFTFPTNLPNSVAQSALVYTYVCSSPTSARRMISFHQKRLHLRGSTVLKCRHGRNYQQSQTLFTFGFLARINIAVEA